MIDEKFLPPVLLGGIHNPMVLRDVKRLCETLITTLERKDNKEVYLCHIIPTIQLNSAIAVTPSGNGYNVGGILKKIINNSLCKEAILKVIDVCGFDTQHPRINQVISENISRNGMHGFITLCKMISQCTSHKSFKAMLKDVSTSLNNYRFGYDVCLKELFGEERGTDTAMQQLRVMWLKKVIAEIDKRLEGSYYVEE